mmetsp:Transcript_1592/g.5774  ORF Transcript_1592/g.5774 Transcript_1592/m.5774 type:complete len:201 (+) Transcript_1592:188-790(+)
MENFPPKPVFMVDILLLVVISTNFFSASSARRIVSSCTSTIFHACSLAFSSSEDMARNSRSQMFSRCSLSSLRRKASRSFAFNASRMLSAAETRFEASSAESLCFLQTVSMEAFRSLTSFKRAERRSHSFRADDWSDSLVAFSASNRAMVAFVIFSSSSSFTVFTCSSTSLAFIAFTFRSSCSRWFSARVARSRHEWAIS